MTACPHRDIATCPLYIAAHDPKLARYGCADRRLDEGRCAIDRGKSYEDNLRGLTLIAQSFVQDCLLRSWLTDLRASQDQRRAQS